MAQFITDIVKQDIFSIVKFFAKHWFLQFARQKFTIATYTNLFMCRYIDALYFHETGTILQNYQKFMPHENILFYSKTIHFVKMWRN